MATKKRNYTNFERIKDKGKRLESLINLSNDIVANESRAIMSFNDFLWQVSKNPEKSLRDIFQLFYDMIKYYVPEGKDEYGDSENSIGFLLYDFSKLFVKDCDNPFFADRLFANRFINLVKGFRKGVQNNHIYLFEGPPGSGKSTFLNNLLSKVEAYTKTTEGVMYRTVWRLDIEKLYGIRKEMFEMTDTNNLTINNIKLNKKYIDVNCPNNDHPILLIPKNHRKKFLDELIPDKKFKENLFNSKEYNWVFKEEPCSICTSLYNNLLDILGEPIKVYDMLKVKYTSFSRQFGRGVSIYNPGDDIHSRPITDNTVQNTINKIFGNDEIKYIYSYLALTNNGIFTLMDIKEHNIERLIDLHGIISDGVHKVDLIEERIKSLFLGVINPEDKKHYENVKSFRDRVITVSIPYILDYNTEVAIYKNKFGENIENFFLPRIISNFAKIIISSRLNTDSPEIKKWLGNNKSKYSKYVDKDLLLLKMDIYTGKIPSYLSEEDIKKFTYNVRKEIINASETEGFKGLSGRQSLILFSDFYNKYADSGQLITMEMLKQFFINNEELMNNYIPAEFIESIENLYNYNILQEIKEAIYYYNEEQIARDIQNYLFAINYEPDTVERCHYTGDIIEINEEYFKNFEAMLLGTTSSVKERQSLRRDILREYVTKTVAQEIKIEGKKITETKQYQYLFERYTINLKQNALLPYIENDNFRRAIIDYATPAFNTYDERLKKDVTFLLNNLKNKFKYTEQGAKQICLYAIDKQLIKVYN